MNASKSLSTQKPAKIPYDSLTLRAVVLELRPHLPGGQIQDVRQPTPTEVRLGIRSQGRNYLLALSDDVQFARVHLTATRLPNTPTPPTFCMLLRKYLEGGIIRDVRQRGFDRIFEMEVETYSDEEKTTVTLIAELMGKHSNLILVNASGTILDAAKRITRRVNRLREILPGQSYLSPPEQTGKIDPFAPDAVAAVLKDSFVENAPPRPPNAEGSQDQREADSPQSWGGRGGEDIGREARTSLANRLMDLYAGMSPFLAQELAARALAVEDWREGLKVAWDSIFGAIAHREFSPVRVHDTAGRLVGAYPFSVVQWPPERQEPVENLNLALDAVFTAALTRADFEAVTGELRGKLAREQKRLERQQLSIERTLTEAQRSEELKQSGELILANLWRIQPGESAVTVQDYYAPDMPDRVLTLDPTLSPQENAEAYFRRYRKARDGQEMARQQNARVEAEWERLEEALLRLAPLTTAEEVRSLRARLLADGLLRETGEEAETTPGRGGPDFQGHKIRRMLTPEGYEIYYGETATANDFLTTRVAAPNDFWLHVRAAPSAHVVIRTQGRPADVPRPVLMQAALICARHSTQKHSSLVAVDYTLKKYVRKPRGSAPGSADYEKETTLEVTPQL